MWLHILIGAERKGKTMVLPDPLLNTSILLLDTLTHTPHLLSGLTTVDVPATGLVDFRWPYFRAICTKLGCISIEANSIITGCSG